jgi:SPP1 family predicted phage head-tail adaptor
MRKITALPHRITLQKRAVVDDGYGNPVSGDWQDQFTIDARIEPAKGREEVLAQRLQDVRPMEIHIACTSTTEQIQPDWRAVNARVPDQLMNIHDVRDPDQRRLRLILTCTLGTAT